jgi:hypothetical protein
MSTTDIWRLRGGTLGTDAVDYDVEAIDGGIGHVDEATDDVAASYIVVDTGPWIFGKKVVLPAGVIETVDHDDKKIFVNRTKDEIKNAPEYGEASYTDDAYRSQLGTYYGPGGRGYRETSYRDRRSVT